VLNRSTAFTGVTAQAAESALKRKFESKITNDYAVAIRAQNTGQPFNYSKPDSALAKEIGALARQIDAAVAPTAIAAKAGAGNR
jgi:MinD-like ATPase involved in chromosome partitioning or flagellar assembly